MGASSTKLSGHSGPVNSVAFGRSGTQLVSGSDDCTLRVWALKLRSSPTLKRVLRHSAAIRCTSFSPDESLLASGTVNGNVWLWDESDSESGTLLGSHGGWVTALAFSPDGSVLASASADCYVKLWNVEKGELIGELTGHRAVVNSVSWSQDMGDLKLATTSFDNHVRIWSVSLADGADALAAAPSMKHSLEETANAAVFARVAWPKPPPGASPESLESPYRETLVVTLPFANTFVLLDVETEYVQTVKGSHEDSVNALAVADRTSLIATGSNDQTVMVWTPSSTHCHPILTLEGHNTRIMALDVVADGSVVASGGRDGNVFLFRVPPEKLQAVALHVRPAGTGAPSRSVSSDGHVHRSSMTATRARALAGKTAFRDRSFSEGPALFRAALNGKLPAGGVGGGGGGSGSGSGAGAGAGDRPADRHCVFSKHFDWATFQDLFMGSTSEEAVSMRVSSLKRLIVSKPYLAAQANPSRLGALQSAHEASFPDVWTSTALQDEFEDLVSLAFDSSDVTPDAEEGRPRSLARGASHPLFQSTPPPVDGKALLQAALRSGNAEEEEEAAAAAAGGGGGGGAGAGSDDAPRRQKSLHVTFQWSTFLQSVAQCGDISRLPELLDQVTGRAERDPWVSSLLDYGNLADLRDLLEEVTGRDLEDWPDDLRDAFETLVEAMP